jgi:hypothetical protein
VNLVFTVLAAFPVGYLLGHPVGRRASAVAVYLAADALFFTWQTLGLLLDWLAGSGRGFGPSAATFPITYETSEYVAYGAVNLLIVLAGVGLVLLGSRVRSQRTAKRDAISVG